MALPADNIESQEPVEQIEADLSSSESDLEGSESRYGGYGRRYGGYGGYGKKIVEATATRGFHD
jgi:hypothetical protein